MKTLLFTSILVQALALYFGVCRLHAHDSVEIAPPKLSLQQAAKLTDRFLAKHPQKPAHRYFLTSVEYIGPRVPGEPFGGGPYWLVTYSYTCPSIIGFALWVSMKGEVQGAPQK